jgi:hypothetical protein
MARPVELVPLVCIQCSTRLPARPEEAVWVCANCGQGMSLDLANGLQALEVFYHAEIASNQIGRPFWVAQGQAQVSRQTYSGNQEREAQKFWDQPRRFFIPAYHLPLENLLEMGSKMILRPPALKNGSLVRFMPVTLAKNDVRAVADFLVMAIEADRKDKLKALQLQVTLEEPVLWVLP